VILRKSFQQTFWPGFGIGELLLLVERIAFLLGGASGDGRAHCA